MVVIVGGQPSIITRLLIELTLKGVAFSVSPLLGIVVHVSALHVRSNV